MQDGDKRDRRLVAVTGTVGTRRWLAKKIGRFGFALISRPVRSACGNALRVITYHRMRSVARDPFSVSPESFEQQIAWLAANQLAVSLGVVEEVLAGRRALHQDSVLVTIDDGYRDAFTTALPVLRRYGVPAVFFVTVGTIEERLGAPQPHQEQDARTSWDELAEMADGGMAIASHAWTHRSLGRMPPDEVREEAERSRETLENRLRVPVTAFAYPFGTRADFNAATAAILARCGYTCAFTSQHGRIRPGIDPFTLPRIKVEGGEPLWMFHRLVRGGLDGWRWIDRALWRLQASEA